MGGHSVLRDAAGFKGRMRKAALEASLEGKRSEQLEDLDRLIHG